MIRPFRLGDIFVVAQLQHEVVPLDLEWHLTQSVSPLKEAVLSLAILGRKGVCTCVADHREETGRWRGLAQMRQRKHSPEYVITCLAPALASREGTHALWQRLLAHLYVQAGESGGHRVFAGLPIDSEEEQIFRHTGFTAYAQEDVYQWFPPAHSANQTVPLPLRPQRERDSWGLQSLYAQVTPRSVQNAEGSAQSEWEIGAGPSAANTQSWSYVWDELGEITAAVKMRAAPKGIWIRMLLHPDASEHAVSLVTAALSRVDIGPGRRVFCAIRTYETGIASAAKSLGFCLEVGQTLMVKPCTVRAYDALAQMVPSLNGHTEKAAPSAIKQT